MADLSETRRKPVIVLGASGYVGGQIMHALDGSAKWRPIGVSRHPGPGGIAADATNVGALRSVLSSAGGDEDLRVINCINGCTTATVQVAKSLCDAARSIPPRRIIHLSSMAVYGAATGLVAEDHPAVAPVSAYGQAKRESEDRMRRHVDGGGDVVVLRPGCVFGPGSPQWATRIARLLRRHRLGDLGSAGDGCCNLTFTQDLVATVISALDAPDVSGRAFNVASPDVLTWNAFLIRFGIALHATPIRRVPARMLKLETSLLAPVCRLLARGIDHPLTEAITPSLASLFAQDIRLDTGAASHLLGMPATPVDRMIEATVRWLDGQHGQQPEAALA